MNYSKVIRYKDGGGAILCGVRRALALCSYCHQTHTKLCDFVLPNGKTCDKPMCHTHTSKGEKIGIDYCRDHAADLQDVKAGGTK